MKSVTAALMGVMRDTLGLDTKSMIRFSDPRKPANLTPGYKAVGVKIAFQQFDTEVINRIVRAMEARGYHFHYARFNDFAKARSNVFRTAPGTRFCFSKPETAAARCAVD